MWVKVTNLFPVWVAQSERFRVDHLRLTKFTHHSKSEGSELINLWNTKFKSSQGNKRIQCELTALGKIKNRKHHEKSYKKEQIRKACRITKLHIGFGSSATKGLGQIGQGFPKVTFERQKPSWQFVWSLVV